MQSYWVYILGSRTGTLYVGVTRDLERRLAQHRSDSEPGFTSRYRVHRLLHAEETQDVLSAISREKQIKGWSRRKKIQLIESCNPHWKDLAPERSRRRQDR